MFFSMIKAIPDIKNANIPEIERVFKVLKNSGNSPTIVQR